MTTQYKLVSSNRQERFETQVSELLTDGWELAGNPFVAQTGSMTQALIKKSRAKPKPKVNPTPTSSE